MEKNTFRRMDYYIGALRDLFDTLAGFDSWWNVFDTPEDAEMQDLAQVLDSLNGFPEAARPLFQEIQEKPPFVEETPTVLAHIYSGIKGLRIPPGFYDFDSGPLLGFFREQYPQLQQEEGFDKTCMEIGCGLYSVLVNFHCLYLDLKKHLQPGDYTSPIRKDYPNCFAPLDPIVIPEDWEKIPEGWTPHQPEAGKGRPAAGSRGWIYIPTQYSPTQLAQLYRGLVEAGFVEAGKEEDFLLCFDPEADRQGGFVWTATGEKNRKEIVIQALCDLFDLLGIGLDDFGGYIEALCINIPTFTKSAKRKAGRGFSRYYGELKEILKSIQNQ